MFAVMARAISLSGKQQGLCLKQDGFFLRLYEHFLTSLPICLQTNSAYDPSRCFAFVHDLCDEDKSYPVPENSLDVIILIFVLSAIIPDK